MDITVKINVDDLEELALYRDERCDELEGVIRKNPRFKDCMVRRLRNIEEYREQGDPFEIRDAGETHIAWIYEYEVDLLDDEEITWYISAQGIVKKLQILV